MQMGVMDEKTVYPCGGGFNYRGLRIKGHGGADPLILQYGFPVTVISPMLLFQL
jgi:hypothetical protein